MHVVVALVFRLGPKWCKISRIERAKGSMDFLRGSGAAAAAGATRTGLEDNDGDPG